MTGQFIKCEAPMIVLQTDIWRYINVYLLLLFFMLFGVPPAGTIKPRGVPQGGVARYRKIPRLYMR